MMADMQQRLALACAPFGQGRERGVTPQPCRAACRRAVDADLVAGRPAAYTSSL
jgi:hypothetical protein